MSNRSPTDPVNTVAAIRKDPVALDAFYREHIESVSRFAARRVDDA